ncbi:hypothetical protein LZ554_001272 [Drepanopeziza brunnea f. sp. 'monogermtubi']|nr:hypothetical protein LZ554_001272 [Drepanopeziza brunnea f. sp. 'monogermtubi']
MQTDLETEPAPPQPCFYPKPEPKLKPLKSDVEKQHIAERQVVRKCKREASRPYHQFVYQISIERERIQEEHEHEECASAPDINTKSYENVKNTWTRRGIWDKRWDVLPGMSWKHEPPFEEIVREEMGDDPTPTTPLMDGSDEAPSIRIFGSHSLAQSNERQVPVALSPSQQGLPVDIASAGPKTGTAGKLSLSAPNSPPPSSG